MKVEVYLPPKKGRPDPILEEIAALEKHTFPKHESMSAYLKEEVNRRSTTLLFIRATESALDLEQAKVLESSATRPEPPVVGYLIYTANSLCGNITKLAVHGGYRRQGYATALLDAAVEKLRVRRVGSVALHVDPSRTAAAELYKKFGFVVESHHESYYATGRHAVRMVLELGS